MNAPGEPATRVYAARARAKVADAMADLAQLRAIGFAPARELAAAQLALASAESLLALLDGTRPPDGPGASVIEHPRSAHLRLVTDDED